MHKIMKPRMIASLKSTGCGGLGPGELVVFETPFREGRHFAKKPGEFVPLFKLSKSCTKTVSVHGDNGASTLSSARTKEKAGSLTLILAGKDNQQL
jgi:hypothetical protein